MAFTEKQAREWLEKVVEFSKSPDEETYDSLVLEVRKDGIRCGWKGDGDSVLVLKSLGYRDEKHVGLSAEFVAKFIDCLITSASGYAPPVYLEEVELVYHVGRWNRVPKIYATFVDHENRECRPSLAAAVMMVMYRHRFRSVGICEAEGCGKATFTVRPKPNRFCSDRCKQKSYRDRKTKGGKNGS